MRKWEKQASETTMMLSVQWHVGHSDRKLQTIQAPNFVSIFCQLWHTHMVAK